MGRNSSRLWKKIAFFAGIASLVSFVISALCPNYVNENGWLIEPMFWIYSNCVVFFIYMSINFRY